MNFMGMLFIYSIIFELRRSYINTKIVKFLILSFVVSFITACGGGSDSASVSENIAKQYQGFVQKGPFEVGANVVISQLDSSGGPTGNSINTKVDNVSGRFTYQLPNDWNIGLETGSLKISAEGFFFDEANGKKSDKKINLSAITNSPEFSSVNLLTNWAVDRVEVLLQDGKKLASTIDQSKNELLNIFGVDNINQLDIAQLDSFASDNALLLLLSGALMEVAEQNKIDPQQISNEIGKDFSDNGKLSKLGNDWFIRLQARIRDNPQSHVDHYAKTLKTKRNLGSPKGEDLPRLIPLVSRPSAVLPKEMTVEPGALVTLDGSGSHDNPIEEEGRLINYTWFRVDQIGTEIPFSNRFIATPTITAPNEETERLFALVVTDEQKLTDTAVIKVIVKNPPVDNNPPIADSQIDTNGVFTSEDVSISVVLTGSDPDSDPITFITASLPLLLSGGVIDGTPPNLVYTPTPNFHGVDSFNFTVNDGFEDSNTATVEITVVSVNDAPIANAGIDQSVVSGDLVNLSGSGIDIDGTIAIYSWVQISGTTINLNDSSIATPEFTAPQIGSIPETLVYQLIVTDNEGAQSLADTVEIIVGFTTSTNNPPVAIGNTDKGAITLEAVLEGELVTLTGHLSTDDGTIVEYVWEQIVEANHPTVTFEAQLPDLSKATFFAPTPDASNAPLVLKFKLTVKDDGTPSLESNTEVLVHINSRPFADAGNDRTVTKGDNVTLSGSLSFDREGAIKTYAWQQQVGTSPQVSPLNNASTATPNFTAPNVSGADVDLYFELIVTDSNDVPSIKDTVKITVQETCITPVPIASVGVDRHVPVKTGAGDLTVVTLNGSGFSDGSCEYENFISDYVWTQIGPTATTHPVVLNTTNSYSENRPFFTVPDVTVITVLEFQLIVDDWVGGNTSSAPVTMTVTVYPTGATLPTNNPPTGSDYSVEVLGNGDSLNIYLHATDPDGDDVAMTYNIVTDTTSVPLDQGNAQYGRVRFTPNLPVPAMDIFVFTATDQDGNTSAPITVTINKIVEPLGNQAPTAASDTIIVSPLSYSNRRIEVLLEQLYITNPDLPGVDDYIKIVGVVIDPPLPATPSATIDLTYSSTNGQYLRVGNIIWSTSATGVYEYYVIDKYGRTSSTERITIEFVNTKPIANPQMVATLSSASGATIGSDIFPIDLTGSDIDTNPGLTYEIVTLPDSLKNITFDLTDFTTTGKLKFGSSITTPNPFTFTFRVIDKEGLASDPALVTVEGYIYVP